MEAGSPDHLDLRHGLPGARPIRSRALPRPKWKSRSARRSSSSTRAAHRARSVPAMPCRRPRTATPGPPGAAKDIGTYVVSGLLDTTVSDWRLYLSVINVSVLGANTSAPYKNAQDLRGRHEGQARPGLGRDRRHQFVRPCRDRSVHPRALNLTYKHVSCDGGNPAVVATVAGETEITTQLAVEQANMIRGKRLNPLAVLSDKPLELEGYGTIPAVTASVAGLQARRQLLRHLRP